MYCGCMIKISFLWLLHRYKEQLKVMQGGANEPGTRGKLGILCEFILPGGKTWILREFSNLPENLKFITDALKTK